MTEKRLGKVTLNEHTFTLMAPAEGVPIPARYPLVAEGEQLVDGVQVSVRMLPFMRKEESSAIPITEGLGIFSTVAWWEIFLHHDPQMEEVLRAQKPAELMYRTYAGWTLILAPNIEFNFREMVGKDQLWRGKKVGGKTWKGLESAVKIDNPQFYNIDFVEILNRGLYNDDPLMNRFRS